MNRSIYLNNEEVAELRNNRELAKVVSLGSGYDRMDLLSVYCIQAIDRRPMATELEVIVSEKMRFGTSLLTSCYVLLLSVL